MSGGGKMNIQEERQLHDLLVQWVVDERESHESADPKDTMADWLDEIFDELLDDVRNKPYGAK
jgi:hypothetical protein